MRPRILYVLTAPQAAGLLRGQLAALGRAGFEVYVAAGAGPQLDRRAAEEGAQAVAVPLRRELSPLADLRALVALYRLMRRLRPHLTNVGTPKAALLGGLAAWAARVPCRVCTLRGLRWETERGLLRRVLRAADRLACRAAHRVVCVSGTVRSLAVAEHVVPPGKAVVLGSGSSNGVDEARFAPSPERRAEARQLRREQGIPPDAPVIGFIGRLARDKGVLELVRAHAQLLERWPELHLVLAGDEDPTDALPKAVLCQIAANRRIVWLGRIGHDRIPALLHAMDVLALPSRREGFPNVVLEAGAAEKPVVAARATGTADAVVEGVTGLLVPPGDAVALAAALERVLARPDLAARLGRAGRRRAGGEFAQQRVWRLLVDEYRRLLSSRGLPLPEPVSGGEWRAAETAVPMETA